MLKNQATTALRAQSMWLTRVSSTGYASLAVRYCKYGTVAGATDTSTLYGDHCRSANAQTPTAGRPQYPQLTTQMWAAKQGDVAGATDTSTLGGDQGISAVA